MKLICCFIIGLLFCQSSWSGLPPTSVQGRSDASPQTKFNFQVPYSQKTDLGGIKALFETGNKNLLANPSFENTVATSSWTTTKLSGTTFTSAVDTTNFSDGKASLLGTLTSATGEISQDVTPGIQTNGVPMVASCVVKTTATDVQVCARTAAADIQCNTVASAGSWVLQSVNFTGPANGTQVGVGVKNTSSNTETFNMDDCYVGPAFNAQNLSFATSFSTDWQAATFSSLAWTGLGTVTNNLQVERFGDSLYIRGKFTTGTVTGSTVAIPLPSNFGTLTIASGVQTNEVVGYNERNAASTNSHEAVLATAGGTTLAVSAPLISGANSPVSATVGSTGFATGETEDFLVRVPIAGWAGSQLAFRPDVLAASWSGYLTGAGGGWSTTSTALADPSVATTSTTITTTANRNMSCVAESTKLPAITCTPTRTGIAEVCADLVESVAAVNTAYYARLVDGSSTIIHPGTSGVTAGSSGNYNQLRLCGNYNFTSTSAVTFKVQIATSNGSNAASISQSSGGISLPIMWTINPQDQALPSPLLMGSVTTTSTSQDHIERAIIPGNSAACSTATCTLAQQTAGITSVTRSGAGLYTANFVAGTFSLPPTCVVSSNNAVAVCQGTSTSETSTAFNFECFLSTTGAAIDCEFSLLCMGPR